MTTESFLDLLERQHHAAVPFAITREQCASIAEDFLGFLALPQDIKRALHFPATRHRASADGYTDKSTQDDKDPKQFFHWSPAITSQPSYQHWQAENTQVARFFTGAERLYNAIEETLQELFNEQLVDYRHLVMDAQGRIDGILRFLCYAPQPEANFCAKAHFDKGFSTLAIADSAPGLRIGCCNQHPLKLVNHQPGYAVFMPAWMLFEASAGDIKPAWHDVVHNANEQNVNEFCARWSLVYFINSPAGQFTSWDSVHTPLH